MLYYTRMKQHFPYNLFGGESYNAGTVLYL